MISLMFEKTNLKSEGIAWPPKTASKSSNRIFRTKDKTEGDILPATKLLIRFSLVRLGIESLK